MHRPWRRPQQGSGPVRFAPPSGDYAHGVPATTATMTAPEYRGEAHRVEPTLTAVAGARTMIRAELSLVAPECAERAAVCGSELVANAIRHGEPPILLTVVVGPGHAVVAVEDGSRQPPLPRVAGAVDPGGRGTLIVDRLADRWGVEFLPGGKRVWCLVEHHDNLTAG